MNSIDGIYYYVSLSPDEQKLLDLYRKLGEEEQRHSGVRHFKKDQN